MGTSRESGSGPSLFGGLALPVFIQRSLLSFSIILVASPLAEELCFVRAFVIRQIRVCALDGVMGTVWQ